jgi:diguanylate cyclase
MWGWMLDCLTKWLVADGVPSSSPPAAASAAGQTHSVAPVDMGQAQQVLHRVSELTTAVAEDVGQHQDNIQNINIQLSGVAHGDAGAVAELVCKLLTVNQDLQGRLERAELKLQAHSRQLQDVVAVARTDGLTNLMNRRALDEELQRCLTEFRRRGRAAALLMLDVDHFKRFNDTHGHVAGDCALIHVADMLRAQSRETDIVARFGGEEFAVIFQGTTAAAVRQRAEAVRAAIGAMPVNFDGHNVRITASGGLADAGYGDDISGWLKRADAALYAAKGNGRNCSYWFDGAGLARNEQAPRETAPTAAAEPLANGGREAAAELAAEAFADTTFVREVSRRIAEWRRGGAAFTLMLARLDHPADDAGSEEDGTGPQAIRTAHRIARESVRDMDLLTQWTRDGIAILLPGATANDTKIVARRLHATLARCDAAASGKETLSLSIGIAEGVEGNDANRVLQRAYLALAAAQLAGSGNIYIHDGVTTVGLRTNAAVR